MTQKLIVPEGWGRPRGYSHAVMAEGRMVFVSGQIGWDENERFVGDDFAAQAAQVFRNIRAILTAAGGSTDNIVRLTWYVTSKREYVEALDEVGAAYREIIGRHFPAMAVVQVSELVEDRAKVEIEATAVLP